MTGSLDGMRVVQVTAGATGAALAAVLAGWAADVICVEYGPLAPWGSPDPDIRHISLDLAGDEGYSVLLELVTGADVFVTDLEGSARRHLRIDVARLRSVNPDFVYVSCPGGEQPAVALGAVAMAGAVAAALLRRQQTRQIQIVDSQAVLASALSRGGGDFRRERPVRTDTDEILSEVGFDAEAIRDLRARRAVS